MPTILARILEPLQSRKVRVAIATVIAAYAAHHGLNVTEDVVHTILAVGAALILGIAHEDQAIHAAAGDAAAQSPASAEQPAAPRE